MFISAFVNLYTHDIEAGIRFYRDLLGFGETFRTPVEGTPEHVELKLNGFGLGLGTVEASEAGARHRSGTRQSRDRDRGLGG